MVEHFYLQEAGLTEVEAKVYLTLLKLGSALAGTLSRQSGVHRRSVYDVMERLIEKGLVSYIKRNNRRWYQAAHPDRLLELVKEKEGVIKEHLPKLEAMYNFSQDKQVTVFYKGHQGVKTAYDDQLETGKEILVFGASGKATEMMGYYFERYTRVREEKGIPISIIFDESQRGKHPKSKLIKYRYLPEEYNSPATTSVYGDKVCITLWTEEPLAILIKNKGISDSYKQHFKLLWGVAKP